MIETHRLKNVIFIQTISSFVLSRKNIDILLFLSTLCEFPLTRNSLCFIPSLLVESPYVSETCFNRLLENMASTRQLPERYAEEEKTRICNISFNGQRKKRGFDVTAESHPLDTLYLKVLKGTSSFKKLAEVLKIILTL